MLILTGRTIFSLSSLWSSIPTKGSTEAAQWWKTSTEMKNYEKLLVSHISRICATTFTSSRSRQYTWEQFTLMHEFGFITGIFCLGTLYKIAIRLTLISRGVLALSRKGGGKMWSYATDGDGMAKKSQRMAYREPQIQKGRPLCSLLPCLHSSSSLPPGILKPEC